MTPGWRNVRNFFKAFFANGRRALLAATSKEKMLQLDPSSYARVRALRRDAEGLNGTFLVPLFSVQIDSSMSTRSPKV